MELFARFISAITIISIVGMIVSLFRQGQGFLYALIWFAASLLVGSWCEYILKKKMDTKLKNLISEGASLYEFHDSLQIQIIIDLLYTFNQPESFKKLFEKHFIHFFIAFSVFNELEVNGELLNELKALILLTRSLGKYHSFDELVEGLTPKECKKSKQAKLYQLIIQNAIVYAIACTYKFKIPPIYMRAKNALPGTQRAAYSDSKYANYMKAAYPLLATFVSSQHKFWDYKTLAVMGYLINPKLEKEN